MGDKNIRGIIQNYQHKLDKQFGRSSLDVPTSEEIIDTREFKVFKEEYFSKRINLYEKSCNLFERILKIKLDPKKEAEIQEAIDTCHLGITPNSSQGFGVIISLLIIIIGVSVSLLLFDSLFFTLASILIGVLLMNPLMNIPVYLANNWRLKTSNQMVLCIFYVVTYMRHTSNLELAIKFAGDHIPPPLSIDFKKMLWDVESQKYESVQESLDNYLQTWKKWNSEFVESFHMIESSLCESSEDRRISMLEKALTNMLDETYERMIHYAHNLKEPLTMLHMLGIILPILGLVILPLVVSFMGDTVKWYHIGILYNLVLPIAVYSLGKHILSSRPTGYGEVDITEENPEYAKYKKAVFSVFGLKIRISPIIIALIIGGVFIFLGLSPLIIHAVSPEFDIPPKDQKSSYKFLDYKKTVGGEEMGPYGLGATVMGLFVIIGLGYSVGIYYKLKSQKLIKIRDQAVTLEKEFSSALFQLGNRVGDNIPTEIAFVKVAETMKGTISGNFFELVVLNIKRLGMSIDQAIFDPTRGAVNYYPSSLIKSSMKVLVESSKKGPDVTANALVSISRYLKQIYRVNERLRDLMADVISSMKSQISFLTPAIAGIVVGITSMVITIINTLGEQLGSMSGSGNPGASDVDLGGLSTLFSLGVPPYLFQIIVGLYVLQIGFILTKLVVGIERGADKLGEEHEIGRNMIICTTLFFIISLFVVVFFNLIAGNILSDIP